MHLDNTPVAGKLWTAVPVSQACLQRITQRIEQMVHHRVELEHGTRPELVAGFQVILGDRVIDCSLATQMDAMHDIMNDVDVGDVFSDRV